MAWDLRTKGITLLAQVIDEQFNELVKDEDLPKLLLTSTKEMLEDMKKHLIHYAEECQGVEDWIEFPRGRMEGIKGKWDFLRTHLSCTSESLLENEGNEKKRGIKRKRKESEQKTSEVFENWGLTVRNNPSKIFFPTKIAEVCKYVKEAKKNKKRVRASGFRHTWTDLYGEDDGYIISFVPKDQLVVPFNPNNFPGPLNEQNELMGIDLLADDGQKARCKIGAATTGENLRYWVVNNLQQDKKDLWTIPLDVIMKHITYGGSNAPICHGAGWKNPTLSDLVTEVEFVDSNGILQSVNDKKQLKSLAGCFGMMGIVISLTFELDPLTFARMKPVAMPIQKAIPPPPGVQVPPSLQIDITEEEEKRCYDDFVNRCENDYYAEWFWFVFQKNAWVNTWKNDAHPVNWIDYPSTTQKLVQWLEQVIGSWINSMMGWLEHHCSLNVPYLQARLIGAFAMMALVKGKEIDTPLVDALHFRYGIQNMRVHDTEWEIPIPADEQGKPDWSVVQKAWWAVITSFYDRYKKDDKDIPMRLCLEMRIMAGSSITMAPQFGNQWGTCSIEVLTPQNVDANKWLLWTQEITDLWSEYTDPDGHSLNIRPHWAKQWQGLSVRGKEINDYLVKDAYAQQIPVFGEQLQAVADKCGFTLQEACQRFSNPLLRKLFTGIPGYNL